MYIYLNKCIMYVCMESLPGNVSIVCECMYQRSERCSESSVCQALKVTEPPLLPPPPLRRMYVCINLFMYIHTYIHTYIGNYYYFALLWFRRRILLLLAAGRWIGFQIARHWSESLYYKRSSITRHIHTYYIHTYITITIFITNSLEICIHTLHMNVRRNQACLSR